MTESVFNPGALLALTVNAAVNRYLNLDPDTETRLASLGSAAIGVELVGLDVRLCVTVVDGRLQIGAFRDQAVRCWIRGRPAALAGLMMNGRSDGEVSIEGDAELASRFRQALAADIDWEELFSKYLGDGPAHQLGEGARGFASWLSDSRKSMEANLGEYFREEVRVLPTRPEVDEFAAEVDILRNDCDRLEARVARQESKA